MPVCPECRAVYPPAVVACPRCREILVDEDALGEDEGESPFSELEVIQRVPDVAAGELLRGMLEHEGIPAVLRSTALPGYGGVRRDWGTSAWGELLVASEDAPAARELLAQYLEAMQRGGEVTDEDVEGAG
jgi:hypothetical protein